MVTDGEIPSPSKELPDDLAEASDELGLPCHPITKSMQNTLRKCFGNVSIEKPISFIPPLSISPSPWCFIAVSQADILMVTDGEIPSPSKELLDDLAEASEELGLEVHGLLVSSQASEAMQKLCTHLHLFKSWSVVGGESWMY